MNDIINFYDKMDLKYPEIGIAMQDIDRRNPGLVKFIIPILTPNMDSSKLINKTIYQNKNNLRNKTIAFDIKNISLTNFVLIPMPKEVCMAYDIDDDPIIPSGSKWILSFIGGDITKPRPIARYLEY